VASITPPRLEGIRELYEEQFLVFVEMGRLREKMALRAEQREKALGEKS
jgi:hypothetical protein